MIKMCRIIFFSCDKKLLDLIRHIMIKKPNIPMILAMIAELLIFIVTVAFVRLSDDDPKIKVAYIDPGLGSLIIQVIVAGLAGISYIGRNFLKSAIGYCKRTLYKKEVEKD